MELFAWHNSRERICREPQGALPCGTEAVLRLRLRGADAERAGTRLRFWADGREMIIPGEPERRDGELFHVYHIKAPETPQLAWYYFIIEVGGERRFYGGRTGEGKPAGMQPPDFQITVYDGAYKTPDWFKKGIVYQIFPDRFCRGAADAEGRTGLDRLDYHEALGRSVIRHTDWNESVRFLPPPGEKYYHPNDYFGGDLQGIREKLPYLASLGVSCIYLNPIFDSESNHRYNTGDYSRVDPALGSEETLAALAKDAKEYGMRLMLDGVFSHTGDDSVYFNKYGRYPSVGAYAGEASPYYEWYDFKQFPDKYRCWWGFETLPEVKEETPSYVEFIRGIMEKWSQYGATSWRLDVADELPDNFIAELRKTVKQIDPEGVLLGEVWDDASNKVWEKGLRKYVYGHELDSVMNYPFRDGVLGFFTGKIDAYSLNDVLGGQRERYPEPFYRCCMNCIGSHDTQRALSVLSGAPDKDALTRRQQAEYRHDERAVQIGRIKLMTAVCLQYSMPQPPCIYYGDEAGMLGLSDPFNRRTYPWGKENRTLIAHYRRLGELRRASAALTDGETAFCPAAPDVFAVWRRSGLDTALTLVNRSGESRDIIIRERDFREGPDAENVRFAAEYRDGLGSGIVKKAADSSIEVQLQPYGAMMLAGRLED